jgi:two-component system, NarL family, invasion response regulator UvrY
MKQILVVDDHVVVRQGLIQLLSIILEPAVAFDEASTGQEGIDKFNENDYCLVLVDISLPGRNGLDVLKQMRQLKPKIPILVLSMHPDEQYAVRALRAGASGYVTKASASEELKGAIEKALRGEKYVNPYQATLLADAISEDHDVSGLHNLLSDREYQFACMLTAGMTMTQIAQELNLSVKTISSYRSRVLEKLHIKTNAEIINYCITHGIVI